MKKNHFRKRYEEKHVSESVIKKKSKPRIGIRYEEKPISVNAVKKIRSLECCEKKNGFW